MKIVIEFDEEDIREAVKEWNEDRGSRLRVSDFKEALREIVHDAAHPDGWYDIMYDLAGQAD